MRRFRLALATSESEADLTPDDRLLLPPLASAGIDAFPLVWSRPMPDHERPDAILVRSTWDYHLRFTPFRGWIDAVEASGVPLWNPPTLLRWNSDKSYLLDLARDGTRIPPTIIVTDHDDPRLATWKGRDVVVKPTVSGGAYKTARIATGEVSDLRRAVSDVLSHGPAIVQAFVPEIAVEGEISLVFVEGEFMHAVRKFPRRGDFRVQEEAGGTTEPWVAGPDTVRPAQEIVHRLPVRPLYARVDGVLTQAGFVIMELEVIEPSLYLAYGRTTADALAASVRRRLESDARPE